MDIHDQCFASTKKFGRRKTVSKRRAYVNTPSDLKKQVTAIIDNVHKMRKYPNETMQTILARRKVNEMLLDLRYQLDEM